MAAVKKFFDRFWEALGVSEPPAPVWQTQTPIILWIGWQRGAQRFMDDREWTREQRRRDIVMLHSADRCLLGLSREVLVVWEENFWIRASDADRKVAFRAVELAQQNNIKNGY